MYWLSSTESPSGSVVSTGSTCWPKVISTTSSNFLNARSSFSPGAASSSTSVDAIHAALPVPASPPVSSAVLLSVEVVPLSEAPLSVVDVSPFPQAARPAVIASASRAAIIFLLIIKVSPLEVLARRTRSFPDKRPLYSAVAEYIN